MSGTATTTIIEALNETSEGPKRLIGEIVSVLGEQTALELLEETQAIESSGGQMIKRGTRRRTPGGVFFRLAKGKMSPEQRRTVFRVLESERKPKKPKKAPTPPQPPRRRERPQRSHHQATGARLSRSDRAPVARDVSGSGPVRRRRIVEVGSVAPPPPSSSRPLGPNASGDRSDRPEPPRRRIVPPADNLVKLPGPVAPVKLVKQDKAPRHQKPDATTARSRIAAILDMLDRDQARRVLIELALERTGAQGVEARRQIERDLDNWGPKADEARAEAAAPRSEQAPSADVPVPDLGGLREKILANVTGALGLTDSDLARALYDDESSDARRKASRLLKRLATDDD